MKPVSSPPINTACTGTTSDKSPGTSVGVCSAMLALALVLSLLVPLDVARGGNGKGKGGGGNDPPPPGPSVGYWFTCLGTLGGEDSHAEAINNGGVVVGRADVLTGEEHAFRVEPIYDVDNNPVYDVDGDGIGDFMEDLNDLGVWVNHAGAQVLGCTAVSANDINMHGEIVGTAECNGDTRVFVFDPNAMQLILLPGLAGGDCFGTAINEDGDVGGYCRFPDGTNTAIFYRWDPGLGLVALDLEIPVEPIFGLGQVDINNRVDDELQIVTGAGYRLTLGPDLIIDPLEDLEFFDLLSIYGINDLGMFCGLKDEVGKGKNKDPGGVFRYTVEGLEIILGGNGGAWGRDINFSGDVAVKPGWLYHNSFGLLLLDDLVINPPPQGPGNEGFNPFGITDRNGTGFPHICGRGVFDGYKAWVLTPVGLP